MRQNSPIKNKAQKANYLCVLVYFSLSSFRENKPEAPTVLYYYSLMFTVP